MTGKNLGLEPDELTSTIWIESKKFYGIRDVDTEAVL